MNSRLLAAAAVSLSGLLAGAGGCSGGDESGVLNAQESPPTEADYARWRRELVRSLEELGIEDRRVLDAIEKIPRHEFVPPAHRRQGYEDTALPIAEGQSITRPSEIALALQLLELRGDEKVLEVGTGSGYQAAVLACLAREIYSIEIRPGLKKEAAERIEKIRRRGLLEAETVEVIEGDGSRGYAARAPYDAIVVTAASKTVPDELVRQLERGGRLVIPIGHRLQELKLVQKLPDGEVETRIIKHVRYSQLEN